MKKIESDFKEKKGLRETTISNYMRHLKTANCNKNFDSLVFLKNITKVEECMEKYKDSSKQALYTAICSVLKMYEKDDLHKKYFDRLMEHASNAEKTHDKTEKQKENWMEWDEIMKIKDSLKHKSHLYENRLKHMVLSLYTEIEPRRILDYRLMEVVPKLKPDLSTEKNYLALKENVFVFNRYKTDKHYGKQVIDIPKQLRKTINEFLSQHPMKDESMYPFLLTTEGKAYTKSNSMTMLLNRMLKKNVSVSMLRHIFLTHKYGDELKERQKTAEAMGHSISQQTDYIKFDKK